MSRRDARAYRRITIEPGGRGTLRLRIGETEVATDVLDLAEASLKVHLPAGAELLKPKQLLPEPLLEVDGLEPRRLRQLTVQDVTTRDDGDRTAILRADDDETCAVLWVAVERLSRKQSGTMESRPRGSVLDQPRIPSRGLYTEEARLERLGWLRQQTGSALTALDATRLVPERLSGNIENLIGAVEVPVGIAGPLLFQGQYASGYCYAPMATTEGTLVASCTRGAAAMTRSGGVKTRVIAQQMMRVPMFKCTTLEGAFLLANWIRDHVDGLRAQTRRVSRHAKLMSVEPVLIGNLVHVFFHYETGDAAGQNMTTACTWQACQWLMAQMKHFPDVVFDQFLVEGNMSGDKKVTFQSFIRGRGIRVIADCVIDRRTLERYLKITPEQIVAGHHNAMAAAVQSGMIGYNANVANVIAAMFTATGQDIACVHESSVAQLHVQLAPAGGIHASLILPSLVIGTVGGGTHLPAQRALLEMMGCAGGGKVFRLAEMIAGFALALDLSTSSAVGAGEFVAAHERLGRNRPVEWLTEADLGPAFFKDAVRQALGDPSIEVVAVEPVDTKLGSSIVTELTARKVQKLVGLLPRRLVYTDGQGRFSDLEVLVKVKPLDAEVLLMASGMAQLAGPRLAAAYQKHRHQLGLAGCHVRELAIYEQTDPRFVRHVPKIYRTFRDDKREAYVVVMERLTDVALLDSADNVKGWTQRAVKAAIEGLGALHAVWYGREAELATQPWLGFFHTAATMSEMVDLWDAGAVHAAQEFPDLVSPQEEELWRHVVRTIPTWWPELEDAPRTLVHNDMNPRNVALRMLRKGLTLVAYDWELATLSPPQHDLAELLSFVLSPDVEEHYVTRLVELHRKALEAATGQAIDRSAWRRVYGLCLRDLLVNRMAMYMLAHTYRHYAFIPRVIRTLFRLLSFELERYPLEA